MKKVSRTFKVAVVKFLSVEGEFEEEFVCTTEKEIKRYAKKHSYLVKEIVWTDVKRVMDLETFINYSKTESEDK